MIPLSDGTSYVSYADNILLYRPIYTPANYHDLQGDVNNFFALTDGNNLKFRFVLTLPTSLFAYSRFAYMFHFIYKCASFRLHMGMT